MLHRKIQIVLTAVVVGAMLFGMTTGAQAGSQPAAASAIIVTAVPDADSAEVHQMAQALKAGQEITVEEPGRTALTLRLDPGALVAVPSADATLTPLPGDASQTQARTCVRAYTIAAAIFGAGAVLIGTIVAAALASGAATITIVGFTYSTGTWAAIAGVAGSWSALLAYITSITC
jgi:hypothetical protein